MSYNIETIPEFDKELKKLAKKYKSIKKDFSTLLLELQENPTQGDHLGNDIYKVRLAIASKNKGKSGGARIITFVKTEDEKIILLAIYNKGDKDSISNKEIQELLKQQNS
jgi:mRNA-degrading endonuclease RelE of RelBE toxin-antitoxin system